MKSNACTKVEASGLCEASKALCTKYKEVDCSAKVTCDPVKLPCLKTAGGLVCLAKKSGVCDKTEAFLCTKFQ